MNNQFEKLMQFAEDSRNINLTSDELRSFQKSLKNEVATSIVVLDTAFQNIANLAERLQFVSRLMNDFNALFGKFSGLPQPLQTICLIEIEPLKYLFEKEIAENFEALAQKEEAEKLLCELQKEEIRKRSKRMRRLIWLTTAIALFLLAISINTINAFSVRK